MNPRSSFFKKQGAARRHEERRMIFVMKSAKCKRSERWRNIFARREPKLKLIGSAASPALEREFRRKLLQERRVVLKQKQKQHQQHQQHQ
jgi:hypothetical protein